VARKIKLTRSVEVAAEVDVLVAGGGIGGCPAAVAAARAGAKTMLVDRFGYLGGNMGPGMFSGGVLHLAIEQKFEQLQRLFGISGEFVSRCEAHTDHLLGRDYFRDSQVVAYVWQRMMEESGVDLLLNACATDPIMEDDTIGGLIIETRSGPVAVRAKVTIDATGNAEVGKRAGAEMLEGARYVHPGMYFAIANVDTAKYLAWLPTVQVSEEDDKWAMDVQKTLGSWGSGHMRNLFPLMRQAWRVGEYRFIKPIGTIGAVTVDHGFYKPVRDIIGGQVGVADSNLTSDTTRQIDVGNHRVMQELEQGCRQYIFETAQFMRRYVPGFENSHLHMISPYFHNRGCQGMICEYRLTKEDAANGARFDDVIFQDYTNEPGQTYDFPYRQLVPKGVNGLLATGKSAIIDPPSNRARWKMLMLGEVTGAAAALAVQQDVTPGKIDVHRLQAILREKHRHPLREV
jgi:hypothetical protein